MDILHNKEIQKIIADYQQISKEDLNLGLNIFTLTSDFFYRENYHSDIIKAFLDPSGAHNGGNLFLNLFIEMINKDSSGNKIDIQNYEDSIVTREKGHIDILIRSKNKHCIIIENKMNNAVDMDRQLPRYYEAMQENGYKVDAIVYLPLNNRKKPSKESWDMSDINEVSSLIKIIPAYADKDICLVNDWIEPSIIQSKNIDCISLLRQYSQLIKSLTPYNMTDELRNNLLKQLTDNPELFEQTLTLVEIIQELPETMATSLRNKLEQDQKSKISVFPWRDKNTCVIEFKGVDTAITNQIYIFTWFDQNCAYKLAVRSYIGKVYVDTAWLLPSSTSQKMEKNENGDFSCSFPFGKEDDVVNFVWELVQLANKQGIDLDTNR